MITDKIDDVLFSLHPDCKTCVNCKRLYNGNVYKTVHSSKRNPLLIYQMRSMVCIFCHIVLWGLENITEDELQLLIQHTQQRKNDPKQKFTKKIS